MAYEVTWTGAAYGIRGNPNPNPTHPTPTPNQAPPMAYEGGTQQEATPPLTLTLTQP